MDRMTGPSPAKTPAPGRSVARRVPGVVELFRSSLWLGLVGFGGGVSVLSNLHVLAVKERAWLTEREFANTATVAQMLPGGAAANALAYIGLRFHGQRGAALGYVGFILPGFVLVLALSALYAHFGAAPHAETLLAGLNAAVVGIVAALTLRMVRTAVARGWQMGVAAGALLLSLAGGASSGEIALLGIAAGLLVDLGQKRARLSRMRRGPGRAKPGRPPPPVALPDEGERLPHAAAAEPDAADDRPPLAAFLPTVWPALHGIAWLGLALVFLRTGLGAYGGGFAIIPHLRNTVLAQHWLTEKQFADGVAIGKLTPGPVLLMGTFIGYLVHGLVGAVVATAAIFAAPYVLVVVLGRVLVRIRSRREVRAGLRGLTPAVVGLMGAAALTLGAGLRGAPELAIAAATTLTLTRFQPSPALVLALGGAFRIALSLWGL